MNSETEEYESACLRFALGEKLISGFRKGHASCLRRAWKNEFSAAYFAPVEIAGLYWHFVDIVWIVIFTAVYLLEYL